MPPSNVRTSTRREEDDGPGFIADSLIQVPVDFATRGPSAARRADVASTAQVHASELSADNSTVDAGSTEVCGTEDVDVASMVSETASAVGDAVADAVDALPGPSDLF